MNPNTYKSYWNASINNDILTLKTFTNVHLSSNILKNIGKFGSYNLFRLLINKRIINIQDAKIIISSIKLGHKRHITLMKDMIHIHFALILDQCTKYDIKWYKELIDKNMNKHMNKETLENLIILDDVEYYKKIEHKFDSVYVDHCCSVKMFRAITKNKIVNIDQTFCKAFEINNIELAEAIRASVNDYRELLKNWNKKVIIDVNFLVQVHRSNFLFDQYRLHLEKSSLQTIKEIYNDFNIRYDDNYLKNAIFNSTDVIEWSIRIYKYDETCSNPHMFRGCKNAIENNDVNKAKWFYDRCTSIHEHVRDICEENLTNISVNMLIWINANFVIDMEHLLTCIANSDEINIDVIEYMKINRSDIFNDDILFDIVTTNVDYGIELYEYFSHIEIENKNEILSMYNEVTLTPYIASKIIEYFGEQIELYNQFIDVCDVQNIDMIMWFEENISKFTFMIKNGIYIPHYKIKLTPYVGKNDCVICYGKSTCITKCNHHYCNDCIKKWSENHNICPYCKQEL